MVPVWLFPKTPREMQMQTASSSEVSGLGSVPPDASRPRYRSAPASTSETCRPSESNCFLITTHIQCLSIVLNDLLFDWFLFWRLDLAETAVLRGCREATGGAQAKKGENLRSRSNDKEACGHRTSRRGDRVLRVSERELVRSIRIAPNLFAILFLLLVTGA